MHELYVCASYSMNESFPCLLFRPRNTLQSIKDASTFLGPQRTVCHCKPPRTWPAQSGAVVHRGTSLPVLLLREMSAEPLVESLCRFFKLFPYPHNTYVTYVGILHALLPPLTRFYFIWKLVLIWFSACADLISE